MAPVTPLDRRGIQTWLSMSARDLTAAATANPWQGLGLGMIHRPWSRPMPDVPNVRIDTVENQRGGSGDGTPRPRIQSLSDLIFGLALSISALTLIGQQPTSTEALGISIGVYGFSFMILINVWRSYTSVASLLPSETSVLVDLNIVLLFLVSIEPYLFNELFVLNGGLREYVSGVYSVDLAAMFFIIAFFLHSLASEEKHLVPKGRLRMYRVRRNGLLVGAILLAISTYPYFGETQVATWTAAGASYNLTLREVLWLFALFLSWSRRFIESYYGRREQ